MSGVNNIKVFKVLISLYPNLFLCLFFVSIVKGFLLFKYSAVLFLFCFIIACFSLALYNIFEFITIEDEDALYIYLLKQRKKFNELSEL